MENNLQKQSFTDVFQNRWSWKICNICSKVPVLDTWLAFELLKNLLKSMKYVPWRDIWYGLSKIHKPIVDGVPSFALYCQRYWHWRGFCVVIRTLTISTNKHSFSFCEKLKNFDYNLIMTSFDAESLFTNISLQEMIDFSYQKLFEDKNYIDALYKVYFSEMLTVTKTDSFTLFDNEYYR